LKGKRGNGAIGKSTFVLNAQVVIHSKSYLCNSGFQYNIVYEFSGWSYTLNNAYYLNNITYNMISFWTNFVCESVNM